MPYKTFLALACLGLMDCSTTPKVTNYPADAVPSDEISKLDLRMAGARQDQTDILAPDSYSNAQKHLKKARDSITEKDGVEDVLEELAEARAWLDQAETSAARVRSDAPEVLRAREDGMRSNAPTFAGKQWKEAEDEFLDLTKDNEDDQKNGIKAKDRQEVLALYVEAHQEALKVKHLSRAHEMVAVAKEDGAEKLVPNAVGDAKKKIDDAEAAIMSNRNDDSKIMELAATAELSAQKLVEMNTLAKSMKGQTPESIAAALKQREESIDQVHTQLSSTEDALVIAQGKLVDSDAAADKVALQEKVNKLQQKFDRNEAEVIQKGDTVILRLKGTAFQVNRSDLPSSSFPLMTKAKEVIHEFPGADIAIEGHTDSTGGQERNQRLSQDRADAVRNYLLSDGSLDVGSVTSQGFGYERPLSSNKTQDGRAMNRRVDVVMKNVFSGE